MIIKKMALLAIAVAALAVAFAAPASASAEGWTMEGVPAEEEATIETTGPAEFTGGVRCKKNLAKIKFKPGTTGEVLAFGIEGTPAEAECEPIEALRTTAGCTSVTSVTSNASEASPWAVTWMTNGITIAVGKIEVGLNGGLFCPSKVTVEGIASEPILAAVAESEMESIEVTTLQGNLKSSLGTEPSVHGTQTVLGSNSGTYGV